MKRSEWIKKKNIVKHNDCIYQSLVWKWYYDNLGTNYNLWKYWISKSKEPWIDPIDVHSTDDYLNESIDTNVIKFKPSREMLNELRRKNKPKKRTKRGRRKEALNQPQCKCKHFNYDHDKGSCKKCGCDMFDTKR